MAHGCHPSPSQGFQLIIATSPFCHGHNRPQGEKRIFSFLKGSDPYSIPDPDGHGHHPLAAVDSALVYTPNAQ